MGYIYVAQPYSHPEPDVRYMRMEQAALFVGAALKEGYHPYAPIVHNHQVAEMYDFPTEIDFWWDFDEAMLAGASELWVLTMDGWQDSVGVKREVEWWFQAKSIYAKYCRTVNWQRFQMHREIVLEEFTR